MIKFHIIITGFYLPCSERETERENDYCQCQGAAAVIAGGRLITQDGLASIKDDKPEATSFSFDGKSGQG